MKTYQIILLLIFTAGLAFSLGWFMRGDYIYSSMFNNSEMVMGAMK